MKVKIIGGGLAGCEAAYQLLKRGFWVDMYEMRPNNTTPIHKTGSLAELVCSNSLKSEKLESASGLLKAEMRSIDSLILKAADSARVKAGTALAVERESFSKRIESSLCTYNKFCLIREEVITLPDQPAIIATGPLTSNKFADNFAVVANKYLYFSDAAAPIISAESVDMKHAFFASRYGKGEADYLNCGMNKEEYLEFCNALVGAKVVQDKLLDANYFEGCMPIEIMAKKGIDTLRFGPLRPVGIVSPAGERFFAVVQLRKENVEGSAYNIVGFQTNLTFSEQKRVFAMIPALKNAEYYRYGVMHRNTFVNSPKLLDNTFRLKGTDNMYVAGQLSGVEGYVESAASGMIAGIALAMRLKRIEPYIPSDKTMIGALCRYISNEKVLNFQPMNANYGLLPTVDTKVKGKKEKKILVYEKALQSIEEYIKKEQGEDYE